MDQRQMEEVGNLIGEGVGVSIATANAEFAVILNLLIRAGVCTHQEAIAELDAQISSMTDEKVAAYLQFMRDRLAQAEGPIMTVIEGGKSDGD